MVDLLALVMQRFSYSSISILRKKENKNKVAAGVSRFQYWMKEQKSHNSVLLIVYVAEDEQNRKYLLASNINDKTNKGLLNMYLNRRDIENIFKDADRVELPTSSCNPSMRFFCVVLSFFLFTLWQLQTFMSSVFWSLRTFVKLIVMALCQHLKCILNSVGELLFHPP